MLLSSQHYGDLKDSDESSAEDDDDDYDSSSRSYSRRKKKGYFEKIKWGHVAILCMMTMGGLAPFFFMLADNIGPTIGKVSLLPPNDKTAFSRRQEESRSPSVLYVFPLLHFLSYTK